MRDLWQQGTDSVQDMRVVNTDALTQMKKKTTKVFIWCTKQNFIIVSVPQIKKKMTKLSTTKNFPSGLHWNKALR